MRQQTACSISTPAVLAYPATGISQPNPFFVIGVISVTFLRVRQGMFR